MKNSSYTKKEFFFTALILFIFWLLLSFPAKPFTPLGRIDLLQHIIVGIIISVAVAWVGRLPIFTEKELASHHLGVIIRFICYINYLLLQILVAGIDVARRVMRKTLLISPGMVQFRTPLKDDIPITLNANSITLTPGTITVEVEATAEGSLFWVHCISKEAVKATIESGGFVKEILHIYKK